MTPIEYLTVTISAVAIIARIVMFVRNPSVAAPADQWVAEMPIELRLAKYTRPKSRA